jgi:hypothetical protein
MRLIVMPFISAGWPGLLRPDGELQAPALLLVAHCDTPSVTFDAVANGRLRKRRPGDATQRGWVGASTPCLGKTPGQDGLAALRPLRGDALQAQRLQAVPLRDGQLDECFHVEKL